MKIAYGLALAAAVLFGCSSGSKSTRTAAGNDTGTTQPSSISGTQGTAAGANGAQGSATAGTSDTSNASSATAQGSTTTDTNTQGSMGTQGSVSGSNLPPSSSSSSSSSVIGGADSVSASSDTSSLRTVTGSVAKVDENSITLDQVAGGVTLTVDSQTQVIRRGKLAAGISSIREGEQVRASFDPASNRAEKIEVMGKANSPSTPDRR